MRHVALKLLWAVFAGAVCIGGMWLLKSLIVSQSPDFCAGLVGGLLWMFFMGKAWQLFKWTLEDVTEERNRRYPRQGGNSNGK